MFVRQLQTRLLNALGDTPVVCLAGAARTGKTTLVQGLLGDPPAGAYRSLADPASRAWALEDPAGFLDPLPVPAILDDVERVPGLLPWLKPAADRGARFLLTSAATLPALARDLTWRLESFTLWPLAQAELRGGFPGLVDGAFQGDLGRLRLEPLECRELLRRVQSGGYPEVAGATPSRRESWFHGYLAALVRGSLRDLTGLREVRHLTRLLAAPGADPGLAKRCLDILESRHVLAALSSEAGAGFRCCNDAALQAHLLGAAPAALEARPVLAAPLLETFAVMELVKTAPWSQVRPRLAHLRAGGRNLVLLEDRRGHLVAITTQASATVQAEAFRGLRELRDRVGDRLKAGIVLYLGEALEAAGPGLWMAPFPVLWAARG